MALSSIPRLQDLIQSLAVQLDEVTVSSSREFEEASYRLYLDLATKNFVTRLDVGHRDVQTLVTALPLSGLAAHAYIKNCYEVAKPSNYWNFVNAISYGAPPCFNQLPLIVSQETKIPLLLQSPFERPNGSRVILTKCDKFRVYVKSLATDPVPNIVVNYQRAPINFNTYLLETPLTEFTSEIYDSIVSIALALMLEGISNPRFSTIQQTLS